MKPAYNIPSMREINKLKWNGFNVISTFAGCGGSCLGYRMAGFRILWANDCAAKANDTYRINFPNTILNNEDIRKVKPEDILKVTGMKLGELDIFDGSPPCQAFSTAGKREKEWGKKRDYGNMSQCSEELFYEYIRILKGLRPKVFIAENVSGLVKGTAKGYFKLILQALRNCDYNVKVKLLDAQWLGVPQMRQRVIFVGIRNDIKKAPVFPMPLPYNYPIREVIPYVIKQTKGRGFGDGEWIDANKNISQTICTSPHGGNGKFNPSQVEVPRRFFEDTGGQFSYGDINNIHPTIRARGSYHCKVETATVVRTLTIPEVKIICSFPNDFILMGNKNQQWMQLGNAVPPLMMKSIADVVRDMIFKKGRCESDRDALTQATN